MKENDKMSLITGGKQKNCNEMSLTIETADNRLFSRVFSSVFLDCLKKKMFIQFSALTKVVM